MCRRDEWRAAEVAGVYRGSSQDLSDGFIHFSTAVQIVESGAKHRAGQDDLVLLVVDANQLGEPLRWETSRGGACFPHLYGPLPLTAVIATPALPLGADGHPLFPPIFAAGVGCRQ
jgi:uncharacterized protein (DUF952 family)